MTLQEVYSKIDKYLDSSSHRPILVDVALTEDMSRLQQHYQVGATFVLASNYVSSRGLLQMDQLINDVQTAEGNSFLTETATFLKLQGEEELKYQLRSLLDLSLKGKLVILTYACRQYIETFDNRLFDSSRVMWVGENPPAKRTTLYFFSKHIPVNFSLIENPHAASLLQLPPLLESESHEAVFVTTELTRDSVPKSLLDIRIVSSSFDALGSFYGNLKTLSPSFGTEAQWTLLLKMMQQKNLAWRDIVSGNPVFEQYLTNEENIKYFKEWISFLDKQLNGSGGNKYLTAVIATSTSFEHYRSMIYDYLLEVDTDHELFFTYYTERKELLKHYPADNNALISYCKKTAVKEENAIYYLTDNTRLEKETIVKCLQAFAKTHSKEELESALCRVYPALMDYLAPFNYGAFREYFDLYRYAKLTNHISERLVELAENEVNERRILGVRPRAAFTEQIDKHHAHLYFVDAMGIEFMPYIQTLCYKRGLDFQAKIAACNLPSITSFNKEFVNDFGTNVTSIKDLDELKHDGQLDYDYQKVKQPIHIVKELRILDELLARIDSELQQGSLKKAVLMTDHGTSRMAVIAETENKWEMAEKGQHSGRCCPVSDIEEPPICATKENDFYCLLNYDRFKGGKKASVEVHGGATLEEVLVPIIEITKRGQNIECYVDANSRVVTSSFKKVARLKIYIGKTLEDVTILVDGRYYYPATLLTGQQYLYEAEMPDVKKAGMHRFDVLVKDSILKKGLEFELKKEGVSERRFF